MSNTRKPMIAGNWKMHKTSVEAVDFIQQLARFIAPTPTEQLPDIVVCPSFLSLLFVKKMVIELGSPIAVYAQTMESRDSGAYTGEVSPAMLQELEIDGVVIGHSERREYYNETDDTVNAKLKAALANHLTPIVCVGETLATRDAGETDRLIKSQVLAALASIKADQLPGIVVAYEPVWAIGTGKTCDAAEANRVCALIRQTIDTSIGDASETRILYGGSVKPDNIKELLSQTDIDGALVGGASLAPDSFYQLVESAVIQTAAC